MARPGQAAPEASEPGRDRIAAHEAERKRAELERLLNDPTTPLDAARIWALADELRAIMVLPETVAALKKLRFELSDVTTPAEMAAQMKAEYERWGKVITGSNIKLQ